MSQNFSSRSRTSTFHSKLSMKQDAPATSVGPNYLVKITQITTCVHLVY